MLTGIKEPLLLGCYFTDGKQQSIVDGMRLCLSQLGSPQC